MLVTVAMPLAGCTGLMESAIPSPHGSLPSSNSKENIAFLLATNKCRFQEMLREFRKAAPHAKRLSIVKVVRAIDDHEQFDKPDSLRCEVVEGGLKLYHASPGDPWLVDWTTFGTEVPENQQKTLEAAINKQIEKQKTLFLTRKKVLSAADKHLNVSQCLKGHNGKPINPAALESQILELPSLKAQRAQCEDAYLELFNCFGLFFEDLESQGIRVQDAVLDCWKPENLQLATSWYARFRDLEDQLANQTVANATCDEKMLLLMHDTFKSFKEKLADL